MHPSCAVLLELARQSREATASIGKSNRNMSVKTHEMTKLRCYTGSPLKEDLLDPFGREWCEPIFLEVCENNPPPPTTKTPQAA